MRPRRRSAPVMLTAAGWPASRLNGMSPIQLLAAATLVTLGVALSTGRGGAEEASAVAAATVAVVGSDVTARP